MLTSNFNVFLKKYNLTDITMNESQLKFFFNFPCYTRDSIENSEKGFINIDNGLHGGYHWTTFYVRNNESFYFDSFGGAPDNFFYSTTLTNKL